MTRLGSRITTFLFCSWIFLIPTSLAYHYNKSAGLVHGVLVDYRIPTIALSAVIGITAGLFWLLSRHMPSPKTILLALWGTSLFQFGWALRQWFTQHSLTGYIPFGEPAFSNPQIVKAMWIDGSLKILPYGTTVHPHILATFFVVATLLLLQLGNVIKDKQSRFFQISMLVMTVIICILTQSFAATCALGIGLAVFYLTSQQRYAKRIGNVVRFILIALPILSVLFFHTQWAQTAPNTSILRRSQLETISLQMIAKHPLIGVGWNNFTRDMEQYGYVSSTVRFLQPVHHVPLLLISELGIVGWFVIAALVVMILRSPTRNLSLIAALIVTASFDHFLLTLTSGRLLLLLVVFCMISLEKINRSAQSTDRTHTAV